MTPLTRMLAGLLSLTARMLPPGRQQWAQADRSEADSVPAGWPRVHWLAGIGPLAGAAAGALTGALVADHRPGSRTVPAGPAVSG
jgi:hypothetical protein